MNEIHGFDLCRLQIVVLGMPLQFPEKNFRISFQNYSIWALLLYVCLLEPKSKMSECLRTYGPQIIRVPQLQSED